MVLGFQPLKRHSVDSLPYLFAAFSCNVFRFRDFVHTPRDGIVTTLRPKNIFKSNSEVRCGAARPEWPNRGSENEGSALLPPPTVAPVT